MATNCTSLINSKTVGETTARCNLSPAVIKLLSQTSYIVTIAVDALRGQFS